MARIRLMYWKEIPVQVQAEDDAGVVSKPLEDRFQRGVDAISMFDGSSGSDEYLMAWDWGEYVDVAGAAEAVAAEVTERFNSGFPRDFVSRIRELQDSGRRDPRPGAIDNWMNEANAGGIG